MILPASSGVFQLALYFGILAEGASGAPHALLDTLRRPETDDAWRNRRVKLIPGIETGPWLIKKVVGHTPAILGKSLAQRFHTVSGIFQASFLVHLGPGLALASPPPRYWPRVARLAFHSPSVSLATHTARPNQPSLLTLVSVDSFPQPNPSHLLPPPPQVSVDCNSSPAAGRIVSMVKSQCRHLAVDLGFLLEPQAPAEMPERVLGCVRVSHCSLGNAAVPEYQRA